MRISINVLVSVLFLSIAALAMHSCKKDQTTPPVLKTTEPTAITQKTVTSGGNITSNGGEKIIVAGICWGTSPGTSVKDKHTNDSKEVGSFESKLTGLTPQTKYYIKAYAYTKAGLGYGNEVSFTTLPIVGATLTTAEATSITSGSAISGGNITSDGGGSVTDRGVCWSISKSPTIEGSHVSSGTGTGTFTSSLTGLTPNTAYYIRAYATNSAGTVYGNEVSFTSNPILLATMTTVAVTAITTTTAISGGNITSDGGSAVTARGVCWDTATDPAVTGSHTINGTGTGSFASSLTGLTANTTYYVRAYATNSVGTVYGNVLSFTTQQVITIRDIDGNVYQSMTIGNQIWMTENLKTTKYRNGDPIPTGLSDVNWSGTTSGAYSIYNNDNINNDKFGLLYNWYAVTDSRHLCPTGWREPSDADWTILETYLTNNGYGFAGSGNDIAKSMAAASGWFESSLTGSVGNDQASNNSSGFAALPGGFRHYEGFFNYIDYIGFWWSSSGGESGSNDAWSRYLENNSIDLRNAQYNKHKGLSVRCIKD